MAKSQITNNFSETQKVGQDLAGKILAAGTQKNAIVLALQGDLGAGKTTFLQGFAKGLGIKENVLSPTFIIMKKFRIPVQKVPQNRRPSVLWYRYFYHIDCYRLNNPEPSSAKGSGGAREILHLGFKEIISNPENIVAIEWPEKLGKMLPKNKISIKFDHLKENERHLTIKF